MHRTEKPVDAADAPFHPTAGRRLAVGDEPRTRRCLACDVSFDSAGWGNRLCPRCRKGRNPLER